DARQLAHRQRAIGEHAEDDEGRHEQRRHHGAADAELGEIHRKLTRQGQRLSGLSFATHFPLPSPSVTGLIFAPGVRRNCPSTTTRPPSLTPLASATRSGSVSSDLTMRSSTLWSSFTT